MTRRLKRRQDRRLSKFLAPALDNGALDYKEIPLGRRMYSRAFVLRGRLHLLQWKLLLVELAETLGMSPVGDAAVWKYPTAGGAGGNGTTICQPITESFLVVDTWPDHDGAYLFICSCKEFSPGRALPLLFARFGLCEDDVSEPITLKLDPEKA